MARKLATFGSPVSLLVVISSGLFLVGASLVLYAATLPVYTDTQAPERLSSELEKVVPEERQFEEWCSRLRAFETPHKKISDLGRGLVAAGAGLLLAGGIWCLYRKTEGPWTVPAIFILWVGLWLLRIPLSIWYYWLRQERFDYPTWGDSVAIPIYQETISWIGDAIITSGILGILLIGHPLPRRIQFVIPSSILGWIRAAFLIFWLVVLCLEIIFGIPNGDEGMVLASIGASVILLVFLAAKQARN